MQALHTLDLPQVRLIEGNNVYKYPGEYTYEAMKKFLDEGLYREEQADELKLSNAFERYLKEGDTKPIPKKDISDKEIPLSVMDFSGFGFSDRVGILFPRSLYPIMAIFKKKVMDPISGVLFFSKFSTLGKFILTFFGLIMPLAILIGGTIGNMFMDITDPAPELVPIEDKKNS